MITRLLAMLVTTLSMALPASAAAPLAFSENGPQLPAATVASSLPTSADKVQIRAEFAAPVAQDGTRSLVVQLDIVHGWHVNANPASLQFLIPTRLSAHAGGAEVALETDYPPGVDSGIMLGGTQIKVYDDDTRIAAVLPAAAVEAVKAAGSMTVAVRVQSCSDQGICLPPSRLDSRLHW